MASEKITEGLYMADGDICREYRQARNKKMQLLTLAEMNCTTIEQIMRVLVRNGEDLTPTGYRNRRNKQIALRVLETELVFAGTSLVNAAQEYADRLSTYRENPQYRNRATVAEAGRAVQQKTQIYDSVLYSIAQYTTQTEKKKSRTFRKECTAQ